MASWRLCRTAGPQRQTALTRIAGLVDHNAAEPVDSPADTPMKASIRTRLIFQRTAIRCLGLRCSPMWQIHHFFMRGPPLWPKRIRPNQICRPLLRARRLPSNSAPYQGQPCRLCGLCFSSCQICDSRRVWRTTRVLAAHMVTKIGCPPCSTRAPQEQIFKAVNCWPKVLEPPAHEESGAGHQKQHSM